MTNSLFKVCHMTSVHKRYDARILKKECVTLANNGYDVTLVVADNQKDETYMGVTITSINFTPKNRIDRILNSKKKMLAKALEIDADIYHFHDPELIPVGVFLIKHGKKVIYDSHEDYGQDIKGKTWIPSILRPLVAYIFDLYEKNNAKKFDAIITVTPHIVKKFSQYHNNVCMVTNYPILQETAPNIAQKKKQVCFTGLISPLWCHEDVIKAVNLLDDDVKYVLAGTTNIDYLKKLRVLDRKERIEYLGYIDSNAVNELQQSSLAGIAILNYGPIVCGNLGTLGNTKIFEYMSAGIPVICTDFVLWKEIIVKWQCGICVSPDDTESIRSAIEYLIQNPQKREEMGKNGLRAVRKEFNWESQKVKLIKLYAELILNK